MLKRGFAALMAILLLTPGVALAANPIVPGWYADPEIRIFAGQYWIYPTLSDESGGAFVPPYLSAAQQKMRTKPDMRPEYLKQTFLDSFSSPDLVHWTKHPHALDVRDVPWAAYAVWAPSAIEMGGKYYLFFGANDVHPGEVGGIGLAVSDKPGGPFKDALGHPLIPAVHNGAQPIDPFVFRDDDGQVYLFYGGWGHCNVVRLASDLKSIRPYADGSTWKEITPPGYVEGSFMIKRNGVYYLMWSEGGWTGPDYRVAYAMGPSATGPFKPMGTILAQDFKVANGAGHHSVVNVPGTDDWYIVYHRRPLGDTNGDHRQLAIERMTFNADGTIAPVTMTTGGVAPRPLPAATRRIH